jgi:hypothetical protein
VPCPYLFLIIVIIPDSQHFQGFIFLNYQLIVPFQGRLDNPLLKSRLRQTTKANERIFRYASLSSARLQDFSAYSALLSPVMAAVAALAVAGIWLCGRHKSGEGRKNA